MIGGRPSRAALELQCQCRHRSPYSGSGKPKWHAAARTHEEKPRRPARARKFCIDSILPKAHNSAQFPQAGVDAATSEPRLAIEVANEPTDVFFCLSNNFCPGINPPYPAPFSGLASSDWGFRLDTLGELDRCLRLRQYSLTWDSRQLGDSSPRPAPDA
jgi:hypothetical protein